MVTILPTLPLKELFNLRWYIQHLIDESEYDDDDDLNNPQSEDNWLLQTRGKFMRYVIYNGHTMTNKHVHKNPVRPIIKANSYHNIKQMKGSLPHLRDCQKIQYVAH